MSELRRLRRSEEYGACEDAVEEAKAELYREQAEELRRKQGEGTEQ